MKKLLSIGLIVCIMTLGFFSAFAEEQSPGELGIVSAQLANVYDQPVPKARLLTQLLLGDIVRVIEKREYRYKVSIPDQGDREGWVQQAAVYIPRDNGRSYLNTGRSFVVISAAKTEVLVLDKTGDHKVPLYGGTKLPLIEKTASGWKVQFPDRTMAIVDLADAMLLKDPDSVTTGEEIATTARRFVGVRHKPGGLTTQGMDMSGLIYIVYRIHGIPFSPSADWLKNNGERVDKRAIKAGDILIFNGEREGLAVDNSRFLSASLKQTVQIAGMQDRRSSNSLHYGVRLVGSEPSRSKAPADLTADEILLAQSRVARLPLNKRIAWWAASFIGTPYDPDPLGLYVRTSRIVADEKVDCMYHTFRSVELALTTTPGEAVQKALELRFIAKGALLDGLVANYDQRYQYGEDMVFSGKWGRNITSELGTARRIAGSRGREQVEIIPRQILTLPAFQKKLRDGDIVFWVKDPEKRVVGEIVAHLAIIRIKDGKPYLIHAAGDKERSGRPGGGMVKEVPFGDYVEGMRFIGAFVTRFDP